MLFSANRVAPVGGASFVMPAIVLAFGLLLLLKPKFVDDILGYIVGASLIVYGVSEILSIVKMTNTMKVEDENIRKVDENIKDVDFEKVDEQ